MKCVVELVILVAVVSMLICKQTLFCIIGLD
jgi:hypothetical protein